MGTPDRAQWIADTAMLRNAIHEIEHATQQCSDADLIALNRAGLLPNGIWAYLQAARVKIN